MSWNPTAPVGTQSVKANKAILQANTTYIETTMGNDPVGTNSESVRDHFWDVGSDEDGRHRFVCSPPFTVGGSPADPDIGTGMDAVLYLKTTNGRGEWFNKTNTTAGTPGTSIIYQVSPTVLRGTVTPNSSVTYITIDTLPANTYGEIFLYRASGFASDRETVQTGVFSAGATLTQGFSNFMNIQGTDTPTSWLKLASGSRSTDLALKVRVQDGTPGLTWNYIITYRAK